MGDSDDDYMSDKFLPKGTEKNDVRPGLLFSSKDKRKYEIYKQQVGKKRPKKYHEEQREILEKGLNTAISSDNKGFKLLQKMGFKAGDSLGKTDNGLKVPITIKVKSGSGGVGRERHIEEVKERKEEFKEYTLKMQEAHFRSAANERKVLALLRSDYYKAQRTCEDLDARNKIQAPKLPYFWTRATVNSLKCASDKDEEEQEEEEEEAEEEINESCLQELLFYLRGTYYYCLYCGITGTDETDLNENCPGVLRNEHD